MRPKRLAEGPQQRLGDRVRRHAQPHAVLTAGHDVQNALRPLENHGERTGPEFLRQLHRRVGDLARPHRQRIGIGEVHDQRVVRRPAFRLEDARHRLRIGGVGTQAVHGLGGKRDEPPSAQRLGGTFDIQGGGRDAMHGRR